MERIVLQNILFLDIETVPEHASFSDLTEEMQDLYAHKTAYQRKERAAEEFYERAGIWAEFGKIVCISIGYFSQLLPERKFRVTSFFGEEKQLLLDFKQMLADNFSKPNQLLCAHNGKEFDFPYIARRCIIHGISLPNKLNLFGKKPWEVPHLDTMELWKFGDYKHYTSVKLLTSILQIPSPKDDIDGSQVRQVYYEEGDIDRIITYCEKDVVTVAQILLRFRNDPLLEAHEIRHIAR
ncbi:MAG: 3'-5' exonuclease [Flavobacteriaceae bacterium]|nr:3'-5' exonuclease [Flavobacteriaceae bacterium]